MKKRIVIIDDHVMMAMGIKAALLELYSEELEFEMYHFYETAKDAIESDGHLVDIFIVDCSLNGKRKGSDLFPFIQQFYPGAKIITISTDPASNEEALKLGANAAWGKDEEPDQLIAILQSF